MNWWTRTRSPTDRRAVKAAIRDLEEGQYQLAAGRLDRALRTEGVVSQSLLLEIFNRVTAPGESDPNQSILQAVLAYRVAGSNMILEALNEGMAELAVEWANAFLANFPDDPAGLTLLSLANEVLGNYSDALSASNRLVAVAPDDPRSRGRRAAVHQAIGNEAAASGDERKASDAFHLALADYDVLTTIAVNGCSAYVERARLHLKLGHNERAEQDLSRAIECDPKLVRAYIERAAIAYARADNNRALDDYSTVVRLAPTMTEGFVGRARVWAELGQQSKAEADLTEALRIDPSSWPAYYERAVIRQSAGDLTGARRDFGEVVLLNSTDPIGY